jgi:hypothetical protein
VTDARADVFRRNAGFLGLSAQYDVGQGQAGRSGVLEQ